VEAVVAQGLAGIIVSNTTLSRPSLVSRHRDEAGGLSGAPLAPLAAEKLKAFAQASAGRLVLIAAGGIASGSQAYAALRAGASAVQLYSAMVFEGPGIAVRIGRELARILQAEGFRSVGEAVGEH
jgi:dihydroorotate dehydrogenase